MVFSAWLLVVGGQVQAAGCASRKRDAARRSVKGYTICSLIITETVCADTVRLEPSI